MQRPILVNAAVVLLKKVERGKELTVSLEVLGALYLAYVGISIIAFGCQILCIYCNENKCTKCCCSLFGCETCCCVPHSQNKPPQPSQPPQPPQPPAQSNNGVFSCCFGGEQNTSAQPVATANVPQDRSQQYTQVGAPPVPYYAQSVPYGQPVYAQPQASGQPVASRFANGREVSEAPEEAEERRPGFIDRIKNFFK